MNISKITWEMRDMDNRRLSTDRRYFSYSFHIPERRRGKDRRSNKDNVNKSKETHMEPLSICCHKRGDFHDNHD